MKYTKITLALTFLMGANLYSRDEAAQGCNGFDTKLYKQLNKEQQNNGPQKNLFFSPHSIKSALNLVFVGAGGKTEKEIGDVVGANNQPQEAYHSDFADMANKINQKNADYDLEAANKLFIADRITITDSFRKRVKRYGSVFESINFGNAVRASATINTWVKEKTREKITNIVNSSMFSSNTCLAILNAIYFKGTWVKPFKKSSTTPQPFHINENNTASVDMMQQVNTFNHMQNAMLQMVELPYKGDRVSMFIILPQEKGMLGNIEESLNEAVLNNAMKQLDQKRVDVRLPKFKIESEYDLKDVLKCLGMLRAFDRDKADFSGIAADREMYISDVVHKAYIETDEQGTEAAAATAVIATERCMSKPDKSVLFNANEPFVFFMRDKLTKATLFMGKVNNPNA